MSPFHERVGKEIFKRDQGECQGVNCICTYLYGERASWWTGFALHAAHYPDKHRKGLDFSMDNGRMLCVFGHMIETIELGQDDQAQLMHDYHTFRNIHWKKSHHNQDQKPPLQFFYDWVDADEMGREGLAQAFREQFNISEYPSNEGGWG